MLKDLRFYLLVCILLGFLATEGCSSTSTPAPAPAPLGFAVVGLTSNDASYGAANVDTSLQDAWGLAIASSGGFWITERASGTVELFDSAGRSTGVRYRVNGPGGTAGAPTGIVANTVDSFNLNVLGSATFIFSSLNGTIAALPQFQGTSDSTKIALDRSGSSSYTGLALAQSSGGARLYVPNIKNQSIDVIDASFAPLSQIPDKNFSLNYTPFNTVVIDSQLYVTHAVRSGAFVQVGAASTGLGIVDIYDLNGNFKKTLIPTGGKLSSPWGLAIAPSNFGIYSGKLLVGNFGDGTINVYDRNSGAYAGTLNDVNGKPVVIEGLWALVVRNGTLYYTSGPEQGKDGEFGRIVPR